MRVIFKTQIIIDDLVFLLVSQIFWNVIFPVDWHSPVIGLSETPLSKNKKKKGDLTEGY